VKYYGSSGGDVTVTLHGVHVGKLWQANNKAMTVYLTGNARIDSLEMNGAKPCTVYRESGTVIGSFTGSLMYTNQWLDTATQMGYTPTNTAHWYGSEPLTIADALHALAGRCPVPYGTVPGDMLTWDGSNWVRVANGTTNDFLIGGTMPSFQPRYIWPGTSAGAVPYWDIGTTNWLSVTGTTNSQHVLFGGVTPAFGRLQATHMDYINGTTTTVHAVLGDYAVRLNNLELVSNLVVWAANSWSNSAARGITNNQVALWDWAANSWSNSPAFGITSNNITLWTTAATNWVGSAAFGITLEDTGRWNTYMTNSIPIRYLRREGALLGQTIVFDGTNWVSAVADWWITNGPERMVTVEGYTNTVDKAFLTDGTRPMTARIPIFVDDGVAAISIGAWQGTSYVYNVFGELYLRDNTRPGYRITTAKELDDYARTNYVTDIVVASTNPIPNWIISSTNPIPNWIISSTNPIPSWIMSATNPIPSWIASATSPIPSWITASTSGLVRATITNGLASTNYVIASTNPIPLWITSATNPIPSWITSATNPIPSWIISATNPIPSWITASTSGLVRATITNGLASTNYVIAATNPIPGWITSATNPIPGWITSATNPIPSWITSATSGLVRATITNGLASTNYVIAATNGLVTKTITNGLASISYVNGVTSGIPAMITAATNSLVTKAITNGLASIDYVTGAISGIPIYATGNNIYVDNQRTDPFTPDGTIMRPYATVSAAMAVIGSSQPADWENVTLRFYAVKVMPGTYVEDVTVPWKPFVSIDLSSAVIVGNITRSIPDGDFSTRVSTLVIKGDSLRPAYLDGQHTVIGIAGKVIFEAASSSLGMSPFHELHVIDAGISGGVEYKGTSNTNSGQSGHIFLRDSQVGTIQSIEGWAGVTLFSYGWGGGHTGGGYAGSGIGSLIGSVLPYNLQSTMISGGMNLTDAYPGTSPEMLWHNVRFETNFIYVVTNVTYGVKLDTASYNSWLEASLPSERGVWTTDGKMVLTDYGSGSFGNATNMFRGVGTTGAVTSVSADTNKYLRGDGNWIAVPMGPAGTNGVNGTNGSNGVAFVTISNVVTLASGSSAYVSNVVVGTTNRLTFGIPAGRDGVITNSGYMAITNWPTAAGITNIITLVPGYTIYNLTVTNQPTVINFAFSNSPIASQAVNFELVLKQTTTNTYIYLPGTNRVYYFSTPTTNATVANQRHYSSWRVWMEGSTTNIFCNQWLTRNP
jgi:hypothetical protein